MADMEWLSEILRRSFRIPNNCKVLPVESQILKGGCHFHVVKVFLIYSEADSELPNSIILKTLQWNKPFAQKLFLYLKKLLNLNDREVMYLNSYEIEVSLYRVFSKTIQGLKLPKVYYIYQNSFQNEFQIIMEDISHCDNGQKVGFSWEKSLMCMKKLALFHIANWNNSNIKIQSKLWDIGGYWTGEKREANKKEIQKAWELVVQTFSKEIEISNSSRNLGSILESRLNDLACAFNNLELHTLVHGDYKITNIFVGDNQTDNSVYAIDWQWFGVGNVAIDVAYFIATSIHESIIENSLELVRCYHRILSENGILYPWEQFWEAYKICWIDFFIYTVVAKWSNMQANDVELYKEEGKDGLHLRSYAHMKRLLTQTEEFLGC